MSDALEPSPHSSRTVRLAGRLAGVLAVLAGSLLGMRTIGSFDIGYHLAYGERTLRTARPVDASPEVYTVPHGEALTELTLPPACWIDEHGELRFPNANWLSQVIFAALWRVGGWTALSLLQAVLTAGCLAGVLVVLRRLGLGWPFAAVGVLLAAVAASERFLLRPELLGYCVLIWQMAVLLPDGLRGEGLRAWQMVLLAGLQWLLVNLHSYWLLGLAMTAAVLAGPLVAQAVAMLRRREPPEATASRSGRLAWLMTAQLLVCFINPWTWRLVSLPIRTLWFFRRYGISSAGPEGGHPWSVIGEFFPPMHEGFASLPATWAFGIVLLLSLAGLLAAGLGRRWSRLVLLAGMLAMALGMRRNIAPGSLLLVAVALPTLGEALTGLAKDRATGFRATTLPLAVSAGAVLLAIALGASIVTQRFYLRQRRPDRFGLGASRVNLPLDAAGWLSANRPQGRLWCDYDLSSNLHFLAEPHPDVPLLTNTWAYPVEVMAEVLAVTRGERAFGPVRRQFGVEVVALRINRATAEPTGREHVPLALQLSANPDWTLVHLDALHAIWLRADGPNATLAAAEAIDPARLDAAAFIRQLKQLDPSPASACYRGGRSLSLLGLNPQAIEVLAEAVRLRPNFPEAWYEMGICHARLGMAGRSLQHYDDALRCLQQALRLDPDFPRGKTMLARIRQDRLQLTGRR